MQPPKVTPDMSADEITRLLTPSIMLNALNDSNRIFFVLSILNFDFSNLGPKLQEIICGKVSSNKIKEEEPFYKHDPTKRYGWICKKCGAAYDSGEGIKTAHTQHMGSFPIRK